MVSEDQKKKNSEAFSQSLEYAFRSGKPLSFQSKSYSFAGVEPKKGEWYFAAECNACQRTTPLFKDPSHGRLARPFLDQAMLHVPCYHCGEEASASSLEAQSMQWA